jgi:hypothetical protein
MATEEIESFAKSVYSISVDNIRMALALTVALAWHVVVKQTIAKIWRSGDGIWAHVMYAVIMTALLVAVAIFASKYLGLSDTSRPIVYAVTPQM